MVSAIFGIGLSLAQAQSPAGQDVDRAQFLRNQSLMHQDPYSEENGVDGGMAAASPNDPDLGVQEILKHVQRYQPFTFSIAAPLYYTSNVALVRKGERGDMLTVPEASVNYAPRLTSTLFGEITVQQRFFYYDRYSELNFGTFDVRLGLAYYLPRLHNLVLRAEYNYERLTFTNSFDDFFSNHSLFFSAELPFRFGRAQQLSLGLDGNISFDADPNPPRRNDFDLYVGYAAMLTRSLSIDLVSRIFVRDYYATDRVDVSEVLALSANYRITKCFTASLASTVAWSRSNHSAFDYNVANIGGALAFTFKF